MEMKFAEKVAEEFAIFAKMTGVDCDLLATYTRMIVNLTFEESTKITSVIVKDQIDRMAELFNREK